MRNKLIVIGIAIIFLASLIAQGVQSAGVEQAQGVTNYKRDHTAAEKQKYDKQLEDSRARQNAWSARVVSWIAEWSLYFQDKSYSFLTAMHWTGKTSEAHQNKVDKLFADSILGGIDSWTSLACKSKVSQTRGATSVAFDLRTESQSAWINGEKSELTREDGSKFFVYKVAWTVIPKPKCNIQYNIRLNNQVNIHPNDFTTADGAQSHYGSYVDVINKTEDYREVCISFFTNDDCVLKSDDNPVKDLCNDFIKT